MKMTNINIRIRGVDASSWKFFETRTTTKRDTLLLQINFS